MNSRLLCLLALVSLVLLASARPAAAAGSIRVMVSPNVLLADGISTATVSAEVRTSSGRPARDGTEVRFYTTAGTITQAAFTSAGIARATLTASTVPQTANISVSAGIDQAVVSVPMVSKLVEANIGGRVMRIQAEYVAFSEDKRFIQADKQVRIRFRGVQIEANSVQVDVNSDTVKALGKVNISSDDNTLVGERLWLNLKTFEGYVVAVGTRKWFSAYGLTELPEKPKNVNPDFDLEDLSDSKLLWVSKQANYVVGERVQVQGARAYVGGVKSFRMPFHQSDLKLGFGESGQYVGVGTEGITLDLPLVVQMSPDATTAFRVGYGARNGGIGNFSRTGGLSVDLVRDYGFSGAAEGRASITNLTSPDRLGFFWNHNHQLGKTTRLVTDLQFPAHRDLYGRLNLTKGMPIGTAQFAMAGTKRRDGPLAKTFSFAFETKPKPVADGRVALSGAFSFYRRDASEISLNRTLGRGLGLGQGQGAGLGRGRQIALPADQYGSVEFRARPRQITLGGGFTLDSSASLRAAAGGINGGFGPAFDTNIRRTLPNNGFFSFGVNYNHLAAVSDLIPNTGKLNASLNLSYPVSKRFKVAALGSMALDAPSRNSILQMSYQVSQAWRMDMLHTFFQYGKFGAYDYQFGIARSLGNRELGIYWSRQEHKFIVEFGAARF